MASLCAARGQCHPEPPQELRQDDDAGVAGRARALGRFFYAVAGLLVPDNFEAPCDCTDVSKALRLHLMAKGRAWAMLSCAPARCTDV